MILKKVKQVTSMTNSILASVYAMASYTLPTCMRNHSMVGVKCTHERGEQVN